MQTDPLRTNISANTYKSLFSLFQKSLFPSLFFLTCREIWKKPQLKCQQKQFAVILSGLGVKFLLFFYPVNLLRPSCGSDTPVYLFKYSLFVKQRLNTLAMFNNEDSYLKPYWHDLCIQMCGICLRQKPAREKSFGF